MKQIGEVVRLRGQRVPMTVVSLRVSTKSSKNLMVGCSIATESGGHSVTEYPEEALDDDFDWRNSAQHWREAAKEWERWACVIIGRGMKDLEGCSREEARAEVETMLRNGIPPYPEMSDEDI